MRRILHSYYDSVCVEILKNTVSAMVPDSRLIVCDFLVPDRVQAGGPQEVYWMDFTMMCVGGKERTLEEFRRIFDAAGLDLVKIYPSGIGATCMIEARLK